jgi:hypothetical protein
MTLVKGMEFILKSVVIDMKGNVIKTMLMGKERKYGIMVISMMVSGLMTYKKGKGY